MKKMNRAVIINFTVIYIKIESSYFMPIHICFSN